MQQYLYQAPQILTDSIFLLYGGQTGTSSQAQRSIAYTMAEEEVVEYLQAYLTPTVVTGTYFWRGKNPLELDYGWITSVKRISINSVDWSNGCEVETVTGCYAVRNAQYGYLDVSYLLSCGGCRGLVGYPPYNIQVAYETGLATGTYTSPRVLQALTLAAQIHLNEIDVSLSNETTGDVGIEFFINQRYHEKRTKGFRTVFGDSAIARRIAKLIRGLRARPGTAIY